MNEFSGYATKRGGQWWAMVRFARDAKPKPIMDKGEKPRTYPDELSATKAALSHVLAYFNGHLVCSGEIKGGSIKEAKRARAERLFMGGGKTVEIERREIA
ncbi:hypothetical protein LH464_21405 [Neorhizobium sp. T786]|uniref:hypothetical protein n=1 Tax=Pseudorhizobium xiangyangii TaxID=2883104 RepID=UPI001D0006F8|nr:hypothetical protein [Neorhizobium xiangyangii]MCB5205027.1 hypothetical protein [Neorhizobium xiangyangii]